MIGHFKEIEQQNNLLLVLWQRGNRLCEFRAVHIDGAAQNVKRAIFHKVTA